MVLTIKSVMFWILLERLQTTGFSQATVTVDNIHSNIGDTLRVSGVTSTTYDGYNGLYRITGITTNNAIEVESAYLL